jgi:hypothetical protein
MPLEHLMKFGSKSNDQVSVSLKLTKLEQLGESEKLTAAAQVRRVAISNWLSIRDFFAERLASDEESASTSE